jgi:alpha-tubulin suppressor-like RCC1 family protein
MRSREHADAARSSPASMRQTGQATRLLGAVAALGILAWVGGCADDPPTVPGASEIELSSFAAIVSDPLPTLTHPLAAPSSALAPSGEDVVYVSLLPGTMARGSTVEIRNVNTGFARTDSLVAGGLDPVAVTASVGDTLELKVRDGADAIANSRVIVSPRRPPKVVRTVPPPKKRDVALNSTIMIVFSEPVDERSITPQTIRLVRGGEVVDGHALLTQDGLTVAFEPRELLAPNAEYTVAVTTGITDLDGDPLDEPFEVSFMTGSEAALVDSIVIEPPSLALAPGDTFGLTTKLYDGSGNELTLSAVTWSSADTTIASVSPGGTVTGKTLGTTAVMATADGKSATATIDVVELVFASVSAGSYHTCGLATSGAAYCWGSNGGGELGNGSRTDNSTPVPVAGVLRFTALTVGGAHTCGLVADGKAYCWGSNWLGDEGRSVGGQLGTVTGEICEGAACSTTPVPVTGGHSFKSLSAGAYHTCGVVSDGTAYCWGGNRLGELGNGTTTSGPIPVPVAGGLTFAMVSAGRGSWVPSVTCGLTLEGEAYCWGRGGASLGNGLNAGPETCPLPPSYPRDCSTVPLKVTGDVRFATIRAASFHVCGLTTRGTAHCWGYLGNWGMSPVSVTLPEQHTYEALELFSGEILYSRIWLVASDGTVFWRDGAASDLSVLPLAGSIAFASVSPGNLHACGISTDRTAYCWGLNTNGQLGDGSGSRGGVLGGGADGAGVPVRVAGQLRR